MHVQYLTSLNKVCKIALTYKIKAYIKIYCNLWNAYVYLMHFHLKLISQHIEMQKSFKLSLGQPGLCAKSYFSKDSVGRIISEDEIVSF